MMIGTRKAQYKDGCFRVFENIGLKMVIRVVERRDPPSGTHHMLPRSSIYLTAQNHGVKLGSPPRLLLTPLPKNKYDIDDPLSKADTDCFSILCNSLQGRECITFQELNDIIKRHGLVVVPFFIEDVKKWECTHYICSAETAEKIHAHAQAKRAL